MAEQKTIVVKKKELPEELQETHAGEYIFEQWNWKLKNRALSKAAGVDTVLMRPTVDTGRLNIETVALCLIKAPFAHSTKAPNYDELDKIPSWLGDKFLTTARELNREVTSTRRKN